MTRSALRSGHVAAAVTWLVLGCSGEAGPGVLRATVETPGGFVGAALVVLDGAYPDIAGADTEIVYVNVAGGETRVVVLREGAGLLRFDVSTPDVGSRPTATILQVAGLDNTMLDPDDGYRVTFARVPS